jgi:hypothetical protein
MSVPIGEWIGQIRLHVHLSGACPGFLLLHLVSVVLRQE